MNASEREATMGRVLDAWLEDLQQERRPRVLPELQQLSAKDIEEVMDLARWYKAALNPTPLDEGALAGLVSSARSRVSQEQASQLRPVARTRGRPPRQRVR